MGSRKGGIVTYARFEFPEGGPVFAGDYKGAAGFAPSCGVHTGRLRDALLVAEKEGSAT